MRAIAVLVVALSILWLGTGSTVQAEQTHPDLQSSVHGHKKNANRPLRLKVKHPHDWEQAPTGAVPELDPNAAGLALVLLAGVVLLFLGHKRRPASLK